MEDDSERTVTCRVRIRLLGSFEVALLTEQGNWVPVGKEAFGKGKTARSVLKRLLAAPNRRASRGVLQEDFWPEADQALADAYLNNAANAIRHVLGEQLKTVGGTIYEVAGQGHVWVDCDEALTLLKVAEDLGTEQVAAIPLLEEALAILARGDYLEGENGTWCYGARRKVEDALRQCRMWLAEAYTAQEKIWQAGEQYRALCQQVPPDEEALRAWMIMLALHERPEEALKHYQDIKELVEAQHFSLSARTAQLVSTIEEYLEPPPFFSLSDDLARIAPRAPSISPQPVLHVEFAERGEMLYDGVEIEILAMALQWTRTSGPVSLLQERMYASLRKQDMLHHDEHTQNISRRHALQVIAGFPIELYGLSHFLAGKRAAPPADVLPLCAAGLVACRELRQYEAAGMQEIARTLSMYLPVLEKLAAQSSPQQRQAAHLAGQSYLLISILADHYGKLDHMEAASRTARRYGQLAQDVNLEASALARLAVKFDYERDDVRALHTYQEAAALPHFGQASPLIQGRIYAGLAGAHAYCLQEQEALAALGHAKEIWPASAVDDPAYHFAYTSDNTLALWSGLALKHTGRSLEAAQAFLEYAPLQPMPGLYETNRADFLNYVASVGLRQHDLDMATLYIDAAATVAWSIDHQQRQAEIRDTLRGMQLLWPREPQVKQLQEKLYVWQAEQ